MFCSSCGTKIENAGNFCPNCGQKIVKDVQEKTNDDYKSQIAQNSTTQSEKENIKNNRYEHLLPKCILFFALGIIQFILGELGSNTIVFRTIIAMFVVVVLIARTVIHKNAQIPFFISFFAGMLLPDLF
mgnify:CR=1 FL=1